MRSVPMRQVHLDFHTSPFIQSIGAEFNEDDFAQTLSSAQVEWINLFGKCHHGMFYYQTKIGTVHPNLTTDLLSRQIAACRKAGIKIGMYTCIGWSEDWADRHPEWMEVSVDGVIGVKKPFTKEYYSWQKLCLNNKEYREVIKAELREEYDLFKPDGFWIDIVFQNGCICKTCMPEMLERGMNPQDSGDVFRHDREVQLEFMEDIYSYIQEFAPEVHIYFNCHPYEMDMADDQHIAGRNKQKYCTYIDIESLPSESWGYSHFPISINYINKHDKDITMMNGKFHTSWGDFGSLRNQQALEYECFRALANGAGSCVGDQLHPNGQLDHEVYKRIGAVFAKLKAKEPWCINTRKIAQIGVYTTRLSGSPKTSNHVSDLAEEGVYRILTELNYTFDYLDATDDLSKYELVILPDCVKLTDAVAEKINAYVQAGGKVLLSAGSAVKDGVFQIDNMGVEYGGEAEYNPRYMRIEQAFFPGIPPMDYVTYEKGVNAIALPGTEVLSEIINPYFNRGYDKFCSHRHTPSSNIVSGHVAISQNKNIIYIANPLFSDYAVNRCMVYRSILSQLILRIGIKPLVKADLPSFVEVTLRSRGAETVMHILNYIIEHKSHTLDTIEECIPLYHREMQVRLANKPQSVFLLPANREIPFTWSDGYARFTLDEINGHEMILFR